MTALRTVFMGSPQFAVPCLNVLANTTQLLAVVCQPDKPAGRGLELQAPAVKQEAIRLSIPVLQPVSIRPSKSNFCNELKTLCPDLIVVAAYGKILPVDVLQIPPLGCWNIHASILPHYRGAAPIQWSIIQGESQTGVTLMLMDEGMDTGPTFFSRPLPIAPDDTTLTLSRKLSQLGAETLEEGIQKLTAGTLPKPSPQDHSQATMAPLLQKEHGLVDFTRAAPLVAGQIRGVDPWPGAYTFATGSEQTPIKLFGAALINGCGKPGEILGYDSSGLHVACGEGAISVTELQIPGKKRMPASAFLSGFSLQKGTILGGTQTNPLLNPKTNR